MCLRRRRPIRPDSNRNPVSSWYPTREEQNNALLVQHLCGCGSLLPCCTRTHPQSPNWKCNLARTDDTETAPHESKQRASYQTISSAAKRGKAPLITSSLSVPRSLTRLANGGELCFRDRRGIGGIRSRGRIVDVSAGEWLATNLSGGSPGAGPLPVARREPGE